MGLGGGICLNEPRSEGADKDFMFQPPSNFQLSNIRQQSNIKNVNDVGGWNLDAVPEAQPCSSGGDIGFDENGERCEEGGYKADLRGVSEGEEFLTESGEVIPSKEENVETSTNNNVTSVNTTSGGSAAAAASPNPIQQQQLCSIGSQGHPNTCRPCAFFWTKGCMNGKECRFCHEWHPPKKKKPMKEQKNLMIIARPDGRIEFMRCTVQEALGVL